MTQRPNLEDCPCCGPQKNFDRPMMAQDDDNFYYVECPLCELKSQAFYKEEKALEIWNKRAPTAGELHWKNNHDSQVAKARVLIERLDMPLERVRAYQHICGLELRVALLEKQLSTMQQKQ